MSEPSSKPSGDNYRSPSHGLDKEAKVENPPELSRAQILWRTAWLIICWICIGLWSEIVGPTLQDLMYRTQSNYADISRAVSMRGAGAILIVIAGGVVVDRFVKRTDLIIAVCLTICSACNLAIPYCNNTAALFVAFFIQGSGDTFVNIGGQRIIMNMWKEDSSGPLHLLHLGFGAGSFIVPQIISSFISEHLPTDETRLAHGCLKSQNVTNINFTHLNLSQSLKVSNFTTNSIDDSTGASDTLQYGFIIVSLIVFFVAGVFFVYAVCCPYKITSAAESRGTSVREIFDLNACAPGHPFFALTLFILIFFWFYLVVAIERIFAAYLFSYSRDIACFSKSDAIMIQTVFWVGYTVGRCAGFISTKFIPMKFLVFIEIIGNFATAILFYFFVENTIALWSCAYTFGFFIGPLFPSGLSWANRYLEITGAGLVIVTLAAGLGKVTFLWTVGYFFERDGPQVLPLFALLLGCLTFILPVVMQSVACSKGDRFERMKQQDQINLEKVNSNKAEIPVSYKTLLNDDIIEQK